MSQQPYKLPDCQDPINSKYVILEGIEEHNRFITNNSPKDNEYAFNKKLKAFSILGYANTIREGQIFLFGQSNSKY